MHSTTPRNISQDDWKEILALEEIISLWGLSEMSMKERLSYARNFIYGAKFDFVSGGPGFFGDLFILQGDYLTGDPPITVRRYRKGEMLKADLYKWPDYEDHKADRETS